MIVMMMLMITMAMTTLLLLLVWMTTIIIKGVKTSPAASVAGTAADHDDYDNFLLITMMIKSMIKENNRLIIMRNTCNSL